MKAPRTTAPPQLLIPALLLVLACCACPPSGANEPRSRTAQKPVATRVPLSARFDPRTQPFAFVVPQLAPVQGVGGVRARDCGVCHKEIYRQWQQSTHAAALRDIQFQAEIHKPSSPRWLCLNCHIPVANQRRRLVRFLTAGDVMRPVSVANPGFDAVMQKEAITCATCHVRPDASGASVIIGPRGSVMTPHPTRADRAALRDICYRCHDPQGERITPLLVCWFETRKELARSSHGKQGKHCVDCHMPKTTRRLAADFAEYAPRSTHGHSWVGGGVPKSFEGYLTLERRGYNPGLEARLERWERDQGKRRVRFTLALENAHAGHWLPTADPERHLLLWAWLEDIQGRRLVSAKSRVGQTWKWHPRAQKIADNRLKPGERRRWSTSLAPPPDSVAARLVLTVLHVRLTSDNARHMQQTPVSERYVPGLLAQVRQLQRHYPMATFLYREQVDLQDGAHTRANLTELLRMSQKEQQRPLSQRLY